MQKIYSFGPSDCVVLRHSMTNNSSFGIVKHHNPLVTNTLTLELKLLPKDCVIASSMQHQTVRSALAFPSKSKNLTH